MSSSIAQLVLDFIVFAVIHYFIIFPLITRALEFIKGESDNTNTESGFSKAYENLKAVIGESEKKPFDTSAKPSLIVESTRAGAIWCERCQFLLEDEPRVTRRNCDRTWCADCVEECFELVKFDLDKPLSSLSKGCESAQKLTIRKMLPCVKHLLTEESSREIQRTILKQDTMSGIDLSKNNWMLDVDEMEEC